MGIARNRLLLSQEFVAGEDLTAARVSAGGLPSRVSDETLLGLVE